MRKPLPKTAEIPDYLPGEVHTQKVKCGKANCHCASGKPHLAYYRFWREKGKLHKAYVRRADLEAVKNACRRWAETDKAAKDMINSPAGDKIRGEIRQMLREAGAPQSMIDRHRNKGGKQPEADRALDLALSLMNSDALRSLRVNGFRFSKSKTAAKR